MRTTTYHFVVAPDGRGPEGAAPELAAVRLISLLPAGWGYAPEFPDGTLSLLLTPPSGTTDEAAHAAFGRTFADPCLRGWTWANRPAD
ncbi:hypothetical protein [Streptomyces sp. NBC_00091]|uniref:hypothetical protein n=1 Tax=Streptomyces sp. NBC_00091 TaxID=2975648 RepID=UPI00225B2AC0|nr:hypothetical protein [Streptomyces sp. NBC_00091]MCX5376678.1 hypothetical protein [Streptomyces sp. NBC_00091]